MPRYYFDCMVNGEFLNDLEGRELATPEEVRSIAIDLVHGHVGSRDRGEDMRCACSVSDEAGGKVYGYALGFQPPAVEMHQDMQDRREHRAAV